MLLPLWLGRMSLWGVILLCSWVGGCLVGCLRFSLVFFGVVGLSLGLIIRIEVAILAKTLGVGELVCVWALRGEGVTAI